MGLASLVASVLKPSPTAVLSRCREAVSADDLAAHLGQFAPGVADELARRGVLERWTLPRQDDTTESHGAVAYYRAP